MTTALRLESLGDDTLLSLFGDLVSRDYEGKANFIRHIDAIDRRKLWAKLGHSCLFDFLVVRYHMSESTAAKRIGAARTARRFPVLFTMVARGEIHLSGIHRLAAHLTPENHESVLAEAKHKTIRQIEKLVARLAPQPDVPSTVRALPRRNITSNALLLTTQPTVSAPTATATASTATASTATAPTATAPTAAAPVPQTETSLAEHATTAPVQTSLAQTPLAQAVTTATPISHPATAQASPPAAHSASAPVTPQATGLPLRRSPDPAPLSPGRYKLQVTLGEDAHSKLAQLQDLLAHQIPNGDPAAIVERALDALLTKVLKRKTAATKKPRTPKPISDQASKASGRWVRRGPAAVRREVWKRDCGRCTFVGADGHRCNETRGLEFAHLEPWAKGGETTAENIALRCRAHNAWEADRDYGADFMARKRQRKASTAASDAPASLRPLREAPL